MYWATGEYDFITADLKENGVLRITLDDQKRRNALSEKMLLALNKIFSAANKIIFTSCPIHSIIPLIKT